MIQKMNSHRIFIGLSIILLLCSSTSYSQQNILPSDADLSTRHVTLVFKQQHFTDVIATLSQKLRLNILVDDEPLPQTVNLEFDGTVKEALDKVGDMFDYTWRQKANGIIVMYKRFQSAAEHPQYNLPELQRMAHGMVDIFKAFPLDPLDDFTPRMNALFGTLTPNQLGMLQNGQTLYGSDLNAEQMEALQSVILQHMLADQIGLWPSLMVQLDKLDRSLFQIRESPTFYLKAQGKPIDPASKMQKYLEMVFAVKTADHTEIRDVLMQEPLRPKPTATETKKP